MTKRYQEQKPWILLADEPETRAWIETFSNHPNQFWDLEPLGRLRNAARRSTPLMICGSALKVSRPKLVWLECSVAAPVPVAAFKKFFDKLDHVED